MINPEQEGQLQISGVEWEEFTVLDGVRFIGRLAVRRALNILTTHLNWGSTTVSEIEAELQRLREEGVL